MTTRWMCAALLVTIAAGAPRASASTRADLTIAEFAAALDVIEVQISALDPDHASRASGIAAEVPRAWTVVADGRSFDVSGEWLRSALTTWKTHPDRARKADIVSRVATLRRDALAYEHPPSDVSGAKAALARILADRQFADATGPSWWARFKARVLGWLERLVTRALGSSAVPTVTRLLIYGLSLIAVVVVFVWVMRQIQQRAALDPAFQPPPAVPSDRPWPAWLEAARSASADGHWRDAIHLAYWCGISFLESQRVWRPDASRTPREYTRAFTETGTRADALKQFTTLLERVWYAGEAADARGFDEALSHLGALGCPSR